MSYIMMLMKSRSLESEGMSYEMSSLWPPASVAAVMRSFLPKTRRHSLTRRAKFFLSAGVPPLWAGYSQSKSRPSNLYFFRNCFDVVQNFLRAAAVLEEATKGLLATFQPPTAMRVFILGFFLFKAWNCAYISGSL